MSDLTFALQRFEKGMVTRYDPINIPHDAFFLLKNCCVYRGDLISKFGAKFLFRVSVPVTSASFGTLDASGNGTFSFLASAPTGASLVLGSLSLSDGVNAYTDPSPQNGSLTSTPSGSGTVNYATGTVTISGGSPNGTVSGSYSFYPSLPIMGFATYTTSNTAPDDQLIFDQYYSYLYVGSGYGNASFNSTYQSSGKTLQWAGANYNLFMSCNFAQALFVSNGNPGMQFGVITAITTGVTTTITIPNHGLVVNDYVWLNEIIGATSLNATTYIVTAVTTNTFTIAANTSSETYIGGGIAQYLTSTGSDTSLDGIRYYTSNGWVNFAPPTAPFNPSTNNKVRYICGATSIVAYKGRLLLCGVWTTSSSGDIVQEPGTFIYSAIGTPFYSSFNPLSITNAGAWYFFPIGVYGGFISFNTSDSIISATPWLDSVLIELQSYKVRLISTNSATTPILYEYVTYEYGGLNKTATMTFGSGVISPSSGATNSKGLIAAGFTITNTTGVQRIDDDNPDFALTIDKTNNGYQRIICQRDYQAEIMYFTFPNERNQNIFPDTTLVYNYHDHTWAIWDESFTAYGTLFATSGVTWADLTEPWYTYTNPWNSFGLGSYNLFYAAGNQQGYVFERDVSSGSAESTSLTIAAISANTLTIYNHNLETGVFLRFSGAIGVTGLNGLVAQVTSVPNLNTVTISLTPTGTYLGGGQVIVLRPFYALTKEFSFGLPKGKAISLSTVALLTNVTPEGVGKFSFFGFANSNLSSSFNTPVGDYTPFITGSMTTEGTVDPAVYAIKYSQNKQWVRNSAGSTGGFAVQLGLGLSPSQLALAEQAPFVLSAYIFKYSVTSTDVGT
jgi:hypothetical protein